LNSARFVQAINKFVSLSPFQSQHQKLADHIRMNRAQVQLGSWLAEVEGKFFVRSSSFDGNDIVCAGRRYLQLSLPLDYSANASGTSDAGWRRLPASLLNVLAFIQTEAAPALFRIHLYSFFPLPVCYKRPIVENKIVVPPVLM
jgi:hypothetical protein